MLIIMRYWQGITTCGWMLDSRNNYRLSVGVHTLLLENASQVSATRAQDSLPSGPQNRKYQTKWSTQHNWYAPYREGDVPPIAYVS